MPNLIKEPCQERRGVDYASLSFFSASVPHQENLVKEILDEFDRQWPSGNWNRIGSTAHFMEGFSHVTGARIELSLPGDEGKNPGALLLTLPGACFYLTPSNQAAFLLWFLAHRDGFRHFTRLDLQSTELRPAWDARRVIAAVEAGHVWVKGHSSYRLWAEREADGSIEDGATLYWGSPRSDRQCRTYDKAAESGWKYPAIRDEVQLRRRWAKAAGSDLVAILDSTRTSQDMDDAIKEFASGVINQHLQYWTLNGADPKNDKNWVRKAEPADWFAERIGRQVASVKKAPRPVQDLQSTVSWGVQQYGRYFALDCLLTAQETGVPLEGVVEGLWERFLSRLADEDIARITQGMEGADVQAYRASIEALKADVAWEMEHCDLPELIHPVL